MRWIILLLTSAVLGACAGAIGPQTNPIGLAAPAEPIATNRVEPTVAAPQPIEATHAPTATPAYRASLPDLGEAPELNNEVWLNTDRPLRLTDLHGKVVLIDMWTFG